MEKMTFDNLLYIWMAIAVAIFFLLLKVTAPYGRHTSASWGPQISNSLGWVFMEVPSMVILLYYMIKYQANQDLVTWILAAAFLFHYTNRTFVFPFRIHTKGKKMPLLIVCFGICFNLVNGYALGYYFAFLANYPANYLTDPRFIAGIALFVVGVYFNWKADNILISLRKPGETGYKIPSGWLFNYISCPNLFGEIIEWTGFALMCWNLPATSFLVWTIANLVPRGLSHHRWYKQQFENYPTSRKAVFPFLF